jgi:hypothetical protein
MTHRSAKHPTRILQEDVVLLPIKEYKRNTNLQPEVDCVQKCSICCENKPVKYVNCHKGGLQDELFGKWKYICKDKAMCFECRDRVRNECPFCKNHKLFMWTTFKGRGPKKKAPFAVREEKRLKKLAKKKKKAEKQRRREERQFIMERIEHLKVMNRNLAYRLGLLHSVNGILNYY